MYVSLGLSEWTGLTKHYINSLSSGVCGFDFKGVIDKYVLVITCMYIFSATP